MVLRESTFEDKNIRNLIVPVEFKWYNLEEYDFTENIEFSTQAGVYIFLHRAAGKTGYTFDLLYCGMTSDLSTRFCGHQKKENLLSSNANMIGVHLCKDEDEAKTLETKILESNEFKFNEQHQ